LSAYVLSATALVLTGIMAWLWESGETRSEPARLLLAWLCLSAITALIAAAGIWIKDPTISLSFTAAARLCSMIIVFLLFMFARSFSSPADFTLIFWSIPLQFGMAAIILNWGNMFKLSGDMWVMDMGSSFALATVFVNWFYAVLALTYAAVLYITLRREGRDKEKKRTMIMIAAFLVLLVASGVRGSLSGAVGFAITLGYLGHLAGVLLLVWAFHGPILLKPAER
jgi:glucan phosphoethanolaminetransferase (alkaline phosphatase superfamily)